MTNIIELKEEYEIIVTGGYVLNIKVTKEDFDFYRLLLNNPKSYDFVKIEGFMLNKNNICAFYKVDDTYE